MNEITCCVPQGFILRPLLFVLYVNDIVEVPSALLPILYADDTSLLVVVPIHIVNNKVTTLV